MLLSSVCRQNRMFAVPLHQRDVVALHWHRMVTHTVPKLHRAKLCHSGGIVHQILSPYQLDRMLERISIRDLFDIVTTLRCWTHCPFASLSRNLRNRCPKLFNPHEGVLPRVASEFLLV